MHWMKHRWLLILPLLLVVLASCSSPAASTPRPTATPTIGSAHLTAFAQSSPTNPPLPTPTPSQAPAPIPTPPCSAPAPLPTNCPLTAVPGTKVFPKGWGGYLSDVTLIGRSSVWAGMALEVHVYTGTQGYHGMPASGWYEWGSFLLYLLTAGCYSMDVSWPGGGWHIVFAAGSKTHQKSRTVCSLLA